MNTFKLEVERKPGEKLEWVIRGLPQENYKGDIKPDTTLYLVGLHHSCDTPESVVLSVYDAIYDNHQVSGKGFTFRDGDVVESAACEVGKYHSHDAEVMVPVPAMRFKVYGPHIVMETPDYAAVKAAYAVSEKSGG